MEYIVSDTDMTAVANAIRTKGNTQAPLEFPSGFESAIGTLGDATLTALINRSITEFVIPSGSTQIPTYFFYDCRELTSVEIPSGVTSIGESAFSNCYKLQSVNIPNGVTFIGRVAFSNCYALISVNIPNGVTSIGVSTFYSCWGLPSIKIPSSVTDIESGAFTECRKLESITCEAVTPPVLGSNVFNRVPDDCAICVPAASVDAYKAASGWSDRAAYIQAIQD